MGLLLAQLQPVPEHLRLSSFHGEMQTPEMSLCSSGLRVLNASGRIREIRKGRTMAKPSLSRKLLLGAAIACAVLVPILSGGLRDSQEINRAL
jgi:hypothetical protein